MADGFAPPFVAETQVVLHRPARTHRVNPETGRAKHRNVAGSPLPLRLIVSEIREVVGRVLNRRLLLSNLPNSVSAGTVALWYYGRRRFEWVSTCPFDEPHLGVRFSAEAIHFQRDAGLGIGAHARTAERRAVRWVGMTDDCLSESNLELAAKEAPLDPAPRDHLVNCPHCRGKVEGIRRNNAFLADLVVTIKPAKADGGLSVDAAKHRCVNRPRDGTMNERPKKNLPRNRSWAQTGHSPFQTATEAERMPSNRSNPLASRLESGT